MRAFTTSPLSRSLSLELIRFFSIAFQFKYRFKENASDAIWFALSSSRSFFFVCTLLLATEINRLNELHAKSHFELWSHHIGAYVTLFFIMRIICVRVCPCVCVYVTHCVVVFISHQFEITYKFQDFSLNPVFISACYFIIRFLCDNIYFFLSVWNYSLQRLCWKLNMHTSVYVGKMKLKDSQRCHRAQLLHEPLWSG